MATQQHDEEAGQESENGQPAHGPELGENSSRQDQPGRHAQIPNRRLEARGQVPGPTDHFDGADGCRFQGRHHGGDQRQR